MGVDIPVKCVSIDAGAFSEVSSNFWDYSLNCLLAQMYALKILIATINHSIITEKVYTVQLSCLVQLYITGIMVLLVESDGCLSIRRNSLNMPP